MTPRWMKTAVLSTALAALACGGELPPGNTPYDQEWEQPSPPQQQEQRQTQPQPQEQQPQAPTCPPAGRQDLEAGFCTADCPCDEGQGGCSDDAHCKGQLICSTATENGWLRRCAGPSGKQQVGASCQAPEDCLSNNCGCAAASNILQCLAPDATTSCSLSSYRCDPQATGDHGQTCAGVPGETWRCVQSAGRWPGESISQVCRAGIWQTFHRSPKDCASCCGDFSPACSAR